MSTNNQKTYASVLGTNQQSRNSGTLRIEDRRPSADYGPTRSDPFLVPLIPLPVKQIFLFGFMYPIQCTDYVHQCLCRQLNNHMNDVFENGQKVYEHPDEFIRDAKEAFMIKFSAHNVCFALAFLGARCSTEGPFLGYVVTLMNHTHQNFYTGESKRDVVIDFIAKIEKFAHDFGEINANDVWNLLSNHLPTQPGSTSVYEGITFKKLRPCTAGVFGRMSKFDYVAYIPNS
uniref:Uncharacterized protein n=1 Tax=Meloidogyne floridensis TaxID=298350 RepID=A0A915NKP3_9BILA